MYGKLKPLLMDRQMDNLTELYSVDRGSFTFSDKEGAEYIKNMFMPSVVAMCDPEKYEDDLKYQIDLISFFLQGQYDFMTPEWVKDNISLGVQNDMMLRIKQRNLEDQELLKKRLETMMPERNRKKK